MTFVLKYVLPGGKVVGYDTGFVCGIDTKDGAKVYSAPNTPKLQIPIVLRTFVYGWETDKNYRKIPFWEGASLKDIRIVAEAV